MERKKLLELIAALFIAAIFISSYISLSNYSSSSQSSQTTTIPQTVYGQGVANAVIYGYSSPISINVSCSNSIRDNLTASNLTSTLTSMENNNSISDFYNGNLNFQVAAGNLSSYQIYTYLQKNMISAQFACLDATGPAELRLPPAINFTVGSQKASLPINSSYRNATLTLPLSKGINTQLKLRVSVLITVNGSLYGPMSISEIQ